MIAAILSVLAVVGLFFFLMFAAVIGFAVLRSGSRSRVAILAPAPGPLTEDGPPRTRGWQRDLLRNTLDDLYERRARKELLADMIEAASDEQQKPPSNSSSKAKS